LILNINIFGFKTINIQIIQSSIRKHANILILQKLLLLNN